ncbi:hypothetical protein NQ317_005377 [Molorchus minor]|uniref:Uncharacterized protein n=1 Tax=Molorchus minor TaxID=1323400 RepID=A0ABQ9IPV6_9CUCU|nr:hypothetical protein NQ317_005377 [Molorchus minor]
MITSNIDVKGVNTEITNNWIFKHVQRKTSIFQKTPMLGAQSLSETHKKQRYEHMKIRERMKTSNTGEYEPSN